VAGADGLSRHLDRQEAHYAVGRCENRIRRSVESHGGRLVDRAGSKVLAYFANNVAALQSAIEMQKRVSDLPHPAGLPLGVRVGVCTGHNAREQRYFPSEGSNPAVSLSVVTEPGHILLSIPKRMKVSPWLPMVAASMPDLTLSCGNRQLGVFQVPWQAQAPVALKIALTQLQSGVDQIRLRYRGLEVVHDGNLPTLKIGRQLDCQLKLRDTRSSRLHATIEHRQGRFVLVDRSANGTFVTLEDQIEFFVHHKELVLFGRGQLSLGAPSSAKDAELVQFDTRTFS
jgi:hypothetical protein